jgi:hypothetical protein
MSCLSLPVILWDKHSSVFCFLSVLEIEPSPGVCWASAYHWPCSTASHSEGSVSLQKRSGRGKPRSEDSCWSPFPPYLEHKCCCVSVGEWGLESKRKWTWVSVAREKEDTPVALDPVCQKWEELNLSLWQGQKGIQAVAEHHGLTAILASGTVNQNFLRNWGFSEVPRKGGGGCAKIAFKVWGNALCLWP